MPWKLDKKYTFHPKGRYVFQNKSVYFVCVDIFEDIVTKMSKRDYTNSFHIIEKYEIVSNIIDKLVADGTLEKK